MTYAEWLDVEVGFRPLSAEERDRCAALLAEAALIIDAYNPAADADRKRLVSCRMVRRQLGEDDSTGGVSFPVGATQGSATALDLSSYSAVLLVYDTYKSPTWFASGGSAGRLSVVLPVNGQSYSFAYPWNTVHWRSVKVSATGVTFGPGKERTSDYRNNVVTGVIHLEVPISDGVTQNNNVCRPLELYGFM